jgi:hypothetical protein
MRSSACTIGLGGLLLAVLLVQAHAELRFQPFTAIPTQAQLSDQLCTVATAANIQYLPSTGFCQATGLTQPADENPMCGFIAGAEMAIASLFKPEGAACTAHLQTPDAKKALDGKQLAAFLVCS